MKILILEDNETRIELFKEMIPIFDLATDAKTAIDLLKQNKYDMIFLDHDLGGQVFVESGDNTGYEVAKYIADNNIKCSIVIHSWNPIGVANIKKVLPHATELLFGTFVCESIVENNEIIKLDIKKI